MTGTKEYQPIVDELEKALPESVDKREELRGMIAFAESWGVIVSRHRRTLLVIVENAQADALRRLKRGLIYGDEGELVEDEATAEEYKKLNADEKKIILNAEVSNLAAELEFVTHLEELIKRRCSIGQSMLNSINIETQSGFNK